MDELRSQVSEQARIMQIMQKQMDALLRDRSMLPRRMSGPLRPSLEMQRPAGGVERCQLARHLNHLGLLSFKFGTLTRLLAQTAGAIALNLQRTIGICIYSAILCEVLEAQLWQLIAWLRFPLHALPS